MQNQGKAKEIVGTCAQGVLDPAKRQRAKKRRKGTIVNRRASSLVGRQGGWPCGHPAGYVFPPLAGSAPLARWQGGSREHGDRVWFSETGHFERRPIPVRTTINPRHQLPHDQSRCITCTLYCHVGQAWYLPQTTDFMCHDEDVAKLSWPRYEANLGRLIFVFDRGRVWARRLFR